MNNEVKGEHLGNDATPDILFSKFWTFVSFSANRRDERGMETVGGLLRVQINLMQTNTTGERYRANVCEERRFELTIHRGRRRSSSVSPREEKLEPSGYSMKNRVRGLFHGSVGKHPHYYAT